jgi:ERF superfamily
VAEEQKEQAKPLTLAWKIKEISAKVKKIKRAGRNTDQGYNYLTIEDTVDAVRHDMYAMNLLLTPQLVKAEQVADSKGILRDVVFDWTLEDIETGEKRTWQVPGSGWDYHDKGMYKAMTGSRKYALILIFNLPVGDNPEQSAGADRDAGKNAAKAVADKKIAEAASKGNKTAIDALSQIEPEKKILISRPEEHHGNFVIVTGYIAVPPLERYFDDTGSKRFKTAKDAVPYWRVPSEYEKGLVELCGRLGIEVEG